MFLSLEQRRDAGVALEEGHGERSASRGHAQVLTRTGCAAVRAARQKKLHCLSKKETTKMKNERKKIVKVCTNMKVESKK